MKKYIYAAIVVAIVLITYYGVNAIFTTSYDIPTTHVERGEFVISLDENGTIDATRAVTLSAPRIRGLTITWLAEEGAMAEEGDPLIKFDATEQMAELADHQSTLKINLTALQRAKQEYTIQEKQLNLDLEKARRNYDEKKHEAPRVAEEARMELELSELNFTAKLDQLTADVEKAQLEVERARDKVNLAEKELKQMTLSAPIPGLIVHLDIWKGGMMGKVQEGDSPWPGQGLINLPDLTEMMVKTTVSEVDASQVDTGQYVEVTLDAHPDKLYNGRITRKSTLARKKDYNSKINVFDIEVAIENGDDDLKPGMSASSKIIIDRIPDVVTVSLEAVFEREGQTFVYLKNKDKREVTVGRRNNQSIEIVSGLEGDEEVCLIDPNLDEPGLPGDKATKPEINESSKKKPGGKRSGKRGGR